MAQDRDPSPQALSDTIVAPATPTGRSALAIVRAAGPGARRLALEVLDWASPEPRKAAPRLARRAGRPVDRVVALWWPAEESPLGEDLLEMIGHGSPELQAELVCACLDAGARPAAPGEFTRRAFTRGRLDLSQARAVEVLIAARGERTRRAALERLEGGLSRAVAAARTPLLALLAEIEARLDHPDEDLPARSDCRLDEALTKLRAPIERLLAACLRGRSEREGLRVCLFGRPNAGKSSLFNALLGRERAITAPEPGTTRDVLEEPAALDGLSAVIVDTAGLREEVQDAAEREGVRRAEQALESCDVGVLVEDSARPEDARDLLLRRRACAGGRPIVLALSKADLPAVRRVENALRVSARTGEGLPELSRAVARAAGAAPLDEGESLLLGARDRGALASALAELDAARKAAAAHPAAWEDRVAGHLREANAQLGLILGESAPDELLHEIFSRFCVGK